MSISEAIILGLTQGLTEFLPVSSSGHLIIVPSLFGFPAPNLATLVAMHLGTLVAVILFFWRDLLDIVRMGCGRRALFVKNERRYGTKTLWLLMIATIPAVIAGWWFESSLTDGDIAPQAVALSIFFMAVILWVSERYTSGKVSFSKITKRSAWIIGLAQVLALIPGISRSGSTIAAGLFLGLSRSDAARFSFLLAIPVSLGALILELPNIGELSSFWTLGVAMMLSFVTAYAVIAGMLRYIEHVRYSVFVWYGVVLAVVSFFVL